MVVIERMFLRRKVPMIRSAFLAMAVAAMVFSANAAFAGGRSGGSSKSNNQSVRIKNTGTAPALVNAINGTATAAGGKTVAGNGIAQFRVKKGAAQAFVQNQAGDVSQTLPFSFPRSQFVYLLAAADATTSTLTFSPPGKIF
jgi:hypothetical protein